MNSGQFNATHTDADADFYVADADATLHVGVQPRPLDVLMPFFVMY